MDIQALYISWLLARYVPLFEDTTHIMNTIEHFHIDSWEEVLKERVRFSSDISWKEFIFAVQEYPPF